MPRARLLLILLLLLAGVATVAAPAASAGLPALRFGRAIDDPAPYEPQTTCDPVAKPGALALRAFVLRAYPDTRDLGIVSACRAGDVSEHHEGRAWDWGVRAWVPRERAEAQAFLRWLTATDGYGNGFAMARRMGVMYVIWDGQIWGSYAPYWRAYHGPDAHRTHVHISLSWEGARKLTSFYGRFAYVGPAAPAVSHRHPRVAPHRAAPRRRAHRRPAPAHHPKRRPVTRHPKPAPMPVPPPQPDPVEAPDGVPPVPTPTPATGPTPTSTAAPSQSPVQPSGGLSGGGGWGGD